MLFEVVDYPHQSRSDVVPRVKLVARSWDDFGYSTLFEMFLVQSSGQQTPVGKLKILQVGAKKTSLPAAPAAFDTLDARYGSLGQSPSFYELVDGLGDAGREILEGLRDITVVPPSDEIVNDPGYRESLLRSGSAQLAYDLRTHGSPEATVEFRWWPPMKVIGADGIVFRFDAREPLGRMIVLVGENAAGKTNALARLALALSTASKHGELSSIPGFARVLAVSFSAFDDFTRPKSGGPLYDYSGLRDLEHGRVDVEKAFALLIEQRRAIVEQGRESEWRDALIGAGANPMSTLSAGQKFVAFVFTNLVSKLRPRSLVLLDEPELHTHPRMLSGVMRVLSQLLERYDSFAILSTHSPIVLQEIPARSIRIFERVGDGLEDGIMVSEYPRESLGAPLDEIVRLAFRIDAGQRNFHQSLEHLAGSGNWTREDIEAVLQEPISLSSRLLLERFPSRSS
jgi:ABC-type ATPase involved in cell division